MKKRRPLWAIFLAYLIPQPVMAFDSGVNAMQAVQDAEKPTLQSWAYNEIMNMMTGFRDMLEPLLPLPPQTFNQLDAEIADFLAQGQIEQARIQSIIESSNNPEPEQIEPSESPTMIASTAVADSDGFFYVPQNVEMSMLPSVTFNEEGRFALDTSKGINLPNLTIDPRDGGTYESEIPIVQVLFDTVSPLQNFVPAPIQSTGTDLYNTITGHANAEH